MTTVTRISLLAGGLAAASPAIAATSAQRCEKVVAAATASCATRVGMRVRKCYVATGAACEAGDAAIARAEAALERKILAACADDGTLQALGYGGSITRSGLVARAQEICSGEAASIAARSFGGPHAAVYNTSAEEDRACLATAMRESVKLLKLEAKTYAGCIKVEHAGRACDTGGVSARLADLETAATTRITAACTDLAGLTALTPAQYVAATATQARCVAARTHGDTGALTLDCGARPAVPVPARGVWTQVVLDSATWGTKCGNGSDYAFWMRLAPAGSPLERVAVDLQGGGVCVFESDCNSVPASLYTATDDPQPTSGMLSTNPAVNPFSDWTMLFLPYCTQDVHIGAGVLQTFPSISIERYGGVNVRASLRYLRDVLAGAMGDDDALGYRPDRMHVLFGGESAGAFGVDFNYHYVLDDLRWAHTTAVPDAGLGLDNGQLLGVAGLGLIAGSAWQTQPLQPPYCHASNCAVGPILEAATAPRLKAVPEQQILNVSNQVDSTQVSTTFFPSTASWISALRASYCDLQGSNGIRYWLPAQTASFHTILTVGSRWGTVTADGVTVRDFLAGAVADPDGVVDHVDEGTLVADYPGVMPIACLP